MDAGDCRLVTCSTIVCSCLALFQRPLTFFLLLQLYGEAPPEKAEPQTNIFQYPALEAGGALPLCQHLLVLCVPMSSTWRAHTVPLHGCISTYQWQQA